LKAARAWGAIISRAQLDSYNPDKLVLTVPTAWFYEPKGARREFAETLWNMWATRNQEHQKDLDRSRIRLETSNGREIGGSRILAGSMIYVDDD
jgi:hypothetical protein